MTIPDALTSSRFVLVPVLWVAAWLSRPLLFLVLLGITFLTDMFDGMAARKLGLVSERGATLDSFADLAVYATLPFCAWLLWPDVVRREAVFAALAVASYFVPITFGLLKYRAFPSHHTWAAKIAVVTMAVTFFLLFSGISPWPLRIATPLFVLAGIEDTIITAMLPRPVANVPTLRYAMKLKRARPCDNLFQDGTVNPKT